MCYAPGLEQQRAEVGGLSGSGLLAGGCSLLLALRGEQAGDSHRYDPDSKCASLATKPADSSVMRQLFEGLDLAKKLVHQVSQAISADSNSFLGNLKSILPVCVTRHPPTAKGSRVDRAFCHLHPFSRPHLKLRWQQARAKGRARVFRNDGCCHTRQKLLVTLATHPTNGAIDDPVPVAVQGESVPARPQSESVASTIAEAFVGPTRHPPTRVKRLVDVTC